MDNKTQQTLRALAQLERDLQACERRLTALNSVHLPVYFSVPPQTKTGFALLYHALAEMRQILQP